MRPEKTDAVAKRMIFSTLGIKPPKKSEEQKLMIELRQRRKLSGGIKEKKLHVERWKRQIGQRLLYEMIRWPNFFN